MADGSSTTQRHPGSNTKRLRPLLAGLTVVAFLASGCGNNGEGVEMSYEQIAYFQSYEVTPGIPSTPGANGVYVLYRITEIENNQDSQFVLNPNRIIAAADQETKEHAAHEAQLLGDSTLGAVNVEPGESTDDAGCTVLVARVENAEETFGNFAGTVARVDLKYEAIGGTAVRMVREEGNTGFQNLDNPGAEEVLNACEESE